MVDEFMPSDVGLMELLRERRDWSIADLSSAMEVTATAVRQRLNRLMAQGYVQRQSARAGRGRPSHSYSLTAKGRRHAGTNYADLAGVLWQEVRSIADPVVRRGLLQRIAGRMATMYGERLEGEDVAARMEAVATLFADRRVPMVVERPESGLPVLTAQACPYPELADQDRSVCAMERLLFSQLVGSPLTLTQCRLDGETCCSFSPSQVAGH